jgi:hypothetical protein
VVKIILESAQMLSTTRRWYGDKNPLLYKSCFEVHPCTIWTRKSLSNYNWLLSHFVALCNEYSYRYLKIHSTQNLLESFCQPFPRSFPDFGLTPFATAMPEEYITDNSVESYRIYYLNKKIKGNFWTRRRKEELDLWLRIHLNDDQFRD